MADKSSLLDALEPRISIVEAQANRLAKIVPFIADHEQRTDARDVVDQLLREGAEMRKQIAAL